MLQIKTILQGDGAWPDLKGKEVHHLSNEAPPVQIAYLEAGMKSGLASLAIRLDLPDGSVVVAETSVRLFLAAADLIRVKVIRGNGA